MAKEMNKYCEGHRERIREKFLKNGLSSFQDYEILEFLLTYVIPRKDTKKLSKELLEYFGSLEKVLKASYEDIKNSNIDGIGEKTYIFLKFMGELPSLLYQNSLEENTDIKITGKNILLKFLREKIGYMSIEKFYVLYLASNNKLIKFEENSSGTLDKSAVYPREIYKNVIKYNAKAIIIAHNHPSGNPKPSQNDIQITNSIAEGIKNFDAILLEHIIITETSYFSFLEEGLI